jgi:hypothetical protein
MKAPKSGAAIKWSGAASIASYAGRLHERSSFATMIPNCDPPNRSTPALAPYRHRLVGLSPCVHGLRDFLRDRRARERFDSGRKGGFAMNSNSYGVRVALAS